MGVGLEAAALAAPWTTNRISGLTFAPELLATAPVVMIAYVGAAALLTLAAGLVWRPHPRLDAVYPAGVGAVVVGVVVALVPRSTVMFDGATADGVPFGGSEPTVLSVGAYLALTGAALVVAVSVLAATRRTGAARPRAGWPHAGGRSGTGGRR